MVKQPRIDAAALLLVLALAGFAGWRSVGYGLWSYGEPGPGLFPVIVSGVTATFAVVALVVAMAGREPPEEFDPEAAQQEGPIRWGKLAIYVGAILVWPWLMVPLGYILSTTIALFVILRFAEGMRWGATAITLVAAVAMSWLVFDHLLGVPLPSGPPAFALPGIG